MRRLSCAIRFSIAVAAVAAKAVFADGLAFVSDVRVAPLLSSRWCQGNFGGDLAFNLYTPANYTCGCTIIAYAQVMRYWRAPSAAVEPATVKCWVTGDEGMFTMIGGVYRWDLMPFTEAECTRPEQRAALGHLAYDLGVASQVNWSRWSEAFGALVADALRNRFGYASARMFRCAVGDEPEGRSVMDLDDHRNAILASLDAKMPVVIGIGNANAARHQAVVDGYGFSEDGRLYCHLNMGWAGADDMWYDLMDCEIAEEFHFSRLEEVGYNIHPSVAGDVISGRILDESGAPVPNARVKMSADRMADAVTLSDAKGIYSFRFSGKGSYRISAEDPVAGWGQRPVVVAKAGEGIAVVYPVSDPHLLKVSSLGVVANRWGEDVVLKPAPTIEIVAGRLEPSMKSAQTVMGALHGADGAVAGSMQIKVGKINRSKGTVKLSATALLMNGKKVTAKATLQQAGDGTMSGALPFKDPIGGMQLTMAADGRFSLIGAVTMKEASIGGVLRGGASGTFSLSEDFDMDVPGERLDALLPTNVVFSAAGGKWKLAKKASVKWAKDKVTKTYGLAVDDSKGKTNLSALKLSYSSKTGVFKGSFTVYALEGSSADRKKLKKHSVSVMGIVVDGLGHGVATSKNHKGRSWDVTVK